MARANIQVRISQDIFAWLDQLMEEHELSRNEIIEAMLDLCRQTGAEIVSTAPTARIPGLPA